MSDVVSEKLFELENDENLLSFKTHDGLPIYLMAKFHLVFENVMPLVMDMKLAEDDRRINVEAVRFLTKAAIHNVLERGKHNKNEIVIYVPSRPVNIDGQWVNRYSDLFADYSVERVKVGLTNRILIIGCGINTEKRIQMAELLEKEVPGYSVVFRPHPGEIEMAKSIIAEKGYTVKLDDIKEVYESLAITKVVISEMSTVLFEASAAGEQIDMCSIGRYG